MPDPELFARAWPEQVSITETYTYHQTIASNPDTRKNESAPPAGVIEVLIPYDGRESFGQEAIGDIQAQRSRWRDSSQEGHTIIGHLALAAHGSTDLGRRLSLTAEHGSWPVVVPIPWAGGDDPAQALDDRRECRLSETYTPRTPQVTPLMLHFALRDDDTPAEQDTEWGEMRGPMLMGLWLDVVLPGAWVRTHPPVVKRLTLGWPCSPPLDDRQLSAGVAQLDRQAPAATTGFGYDAIEGVMYWHDVPGRWGDDRGRLQRWHSSRMILALQHLGDLTRRSELRGEAVVEVPDLLSGTRVAWYDATGRRKMRTVGVPPSLPVTTTLLRLSFEINLEDALHRRERVARQHLHFGELLPDEANRSVVFRALGDLGFEVRDGAPTGGRGLAAIHAERSEKGELLVLRVAMDGRTFKVTRHFQRPNGVSDTVEVDSGEVDVDVTVAKAFHGAADDDTVIRVMNALHQRLDERFPRGQAPR